MMHYRYGVELFSVRNELAKDLIHTLEMVKGMGYEGVEFFGEFKHSSGVRCSKSGLYPQKQRAAQNVAFYFAAK